jgi:hypothetical protein
MYPISAFKWNKQEKRGVVSTAPYLASALCVPGALCRVYRVCVDVRRQVLSR